MKDYEESEEKTAKSETSSKDGPIAGSEAEQVEISDQEFHLSKKQRTDCDSDCDSQSEWVCIGRMSLQVKDKDIILQGLKLTDKYMNASQKLLKQQFTSIKGLCTLKVTLHSYTTWIPNYLKIFHTHGDHWITLTILRCSKDHNLVLISCMMMTVLPEVL